MKILILLTRVNKEMFTYDSKDDKKGYNFVPPIGMAYISSYLKHAGYDVDVLNLNQREGLCFDIISSELRKQFYDIIFMGGVSLMYPNIRDYIKCVRGVSPRSKVVVGGGLISAQPEIMFKLLNPDFGVVFEGEETCLELVKYIERFNKGDSVEFSEVKGIIFKILDGIRITPPRLAIQNLDSLPFPDMEGFGFDEYLENQKSNQIIFDTFDFPRPYYIVGSRSCSYNCTFCFHTTGYKYRQRSIENIMEEIKQATYRYKINVFFFVDELFAHDKKRALEFCKVFHEFTSTVPWEIKIAFQVRVDIIDEELIDAVSNSQYTVFSLGLESYSNTVLKSMRKHTTSEQIQNAVKLIADKHMGIIGAFIFGDNAETLETAQETLDFYLSNQDILRGGVSLTFIIPFQGSPIYKEAVDRGVISDEMEFIKQRERIPYSYIDPTNLTHLSDKDFQILRNKVLTAIYCGQYYAVPTSIKIVNGISEVEVTCPYCKRKTILRNVDLPTKLNQVGVMCRHKDCNGRFTIVIWYEPVARWIVKKVGFLKLYNLKTKLWGKKQW